MIHILIADDHPLFRAALAQAVKALEADTEVLEAGSLASAQAVLDARPGIDLVLLDLHMPDSHGLMGLATLRAAHPAVAVAMISADDEPETVRRAMAYGAAGYIPKRSDGDQLHAALRTLLDGGEYLPDDLADRLGALPASDDDDDRTAARLAQLTPQQFKVLTLVAEGRLNKQIADVLGISERTVKAHLSALFEKLDVRNRTQAGVLLKSLQLRDLVPAQRDAPA
ncbi:response regulator [Pseudomarimonas salicorniae]|uniref:Response regulator transcription factor n=1 Tax=Pseudomarimonas salicorniae TaxID=2933270 RepID=A0ABT0GJD5_9GAMM|nr:response regulator transcription factor [Lysobacter sp. CAU 1642]